MKLAYFHQVSADDDDHELGAAKVLGYVPPTCLLGGKLVWELIERQVDPCSSCLGPRGRCFGREPSAIEPLSGIERAILNYRDVIVDQDRRE